MTSSTAHRSSRDDADTIVQNNGSPEDVKMVSRTEILSSENQRHGADRPSSVRVEASVIKPSRSGVPSSTSSSCSREYSAPVLVNSASKKMHLLPVSPTSLLKRHTRITKTPSEPPPPSGEFSIESILSSLESDESFQDDINGIALVYGRSNLSLATSHDSHRSPIGSGIDLVDHIEGENDRLVLDTNAFIQHTQNLETVQELPSPMSGGSRKYLTSLDLTESTSKSGRSNPVMNEEHDCNEALAVWQIKAKQGKIASGSVLSVSTEIEARGSNAALLSSDSHRHPDLRNNVSSDSPAVRELSRISGIQPRS